MAREDFVPVALDDWYQRRRQDDEGVYFKKVYSQDPSRAAPERGNRQGIYAFTAGGRLLGVKNAGNLVGVTRDSLRDALSKWRALPVSETAPGAIDVPALKNPDKRYSPPTLPTGALVLDIFVRAFDFDAKGKPVKASAPTPGGDWAARDKLWVLESEWRALVPADAKVGDEVAVPPALTRRLAAYHLRNITTGQTPPWEDEQIRAREFGVKVERVAGALVHLRLDGKAVLATDANLDRAERGLDLKFYGEIVFNRASGTFTRFDVVALGLAWGQANDQGPVPPGKTPIGFAIQKSRASAYDTVAPDFAKVQEYLGTQR